MAEKRPSRANLKLVVRLLPPTLDESQFVETIASYDGKYEWLHFVPGKRRGAGDGHRQASSNGRCYLQFREPSDAEDFAKNYHGHSFVDDRGESFRAVVSNAPYQKAPKKRATTDQREDTIESDPSYQAFLESLASPKEAQKPVSAAELQAELERQKEAAKDEQLTPLVLEILARRDSKYRKLKEQKAKEFANIHGLSVARPPPPPAPKPKKGKADARNGTKAAPAPAPAARHPPHAKVSVTEGKAAATLLSRTLGVKPHHAVGEADGAPKEKGKDKDRARDSGGSGGGVGGAGGEGPPAKAEPAKRAPAKVFMPPTAPKKEWMQVSAPREKAAPEAPPKAAAQPPVDTAQAGDEGASGRPPSRGRGGREKGQKGQRGKQQQWQKKG
ncbi:unnamed protein product [Vitrella brassicaformis CCMP3155]|uniref:UPF3 domain-containing protein n=2 Tax=Vitrella brassicaformis TaxID=1169539 RepID=A0A0G4GM24_VITBC|nr:unnamed protein product [Vitrella brassicaformis CCMP3155]|eukprot:CEM31193.1 unnamed protein product [Vitrella brassicaformis CCMP3155]